MPQLDFSSYYSQIFWLIIFFGITYFVLAKILLPNIREIFRIRAERISSDLGLAERLKQEAEKSRQSYNHILEEARYKARQSLVDSAEKMRLMALDEYAKIEKQISSEMKASENTIRKSYIEFKDTLLPVSARIVTSFVKKVANVEVSEQTISGIIAEKRKERDNVK